MTLRSAMAAIAAFLLVVALAVPAEAKHRHHHRHHHHAATDANGNKSCRENTIRVSTAYGISICVDARFASKFQNLFAALKDRGCKITSIVCQAYGHKPGSNHVGGGACDVDQRAKNKTSACMYHAGDLIRTAGLYDGCGYRDCGHVEAMRGLGNYGRSRTYSARSRIRHQHSRPQPVYASSYMDRMGAGL